MRHAALSKPPMKIRDQLVHAIKSTYLGDRLVYRLKIKNIDSLGRPYEYRKWILDHLQKFGTVEDLHLHYTEGGNWFLGEGCAIIVMSPDDKHHVLNHPILKISVEEYNVTR
ncbi:hypothetical protein BD408DRAFT_412119 [Parasitella parasitica]|nr:hypothetical protein BD408DRAFT_412119 [Parasitella parasitica]